MSLLLGTLCLDFWAECLIHRCQPSQHEETRFEARLTRIPKGCRHHRSETDAKQVPKDDHCCLSAPSCASAAETIPPYPYARRSEPQSTETEYEDDAADDWPYIITTSHEMAFQEKVGILHWLLM